MLALASQTVQPKMRDNKVVEPKPQTSSAQLQKELETIDAERAARAERMKELLAKKQNQLAAPPPPPPMSFGSSNKRRRT